MATCRGKRNKKRLARLRKQQVTEAEINKLDLGSIVTQGAHATSSATTRYPTESIVTYDMEKYRSAFDLTSDFVEDNLQGGSVRQTLIEMFTKRIAVDMEIAGLEGDESIEVGDGETDNDNLVGVNDGFIQILGDNVPNANVLDAAGTNSSIALFHALKKKIPARYRVAKPDYVWVVSSTVYDDWVKTVSDRATNLGDSALVTGMVAGPFGIPMLEVPLMPEDLTYGTTASDCTQIWLTPLKNLIWFVQRDITIEWDRQPRTDKWECTIHHRCDFAVENAAMVCMCTNLSISGTAYS